MVHQFVQKEIDDARGRLDNEDPGTAAVFVENALKDIEDFHGHTMVHGKLGLLN